MQKKLNQLPVIAETKSYFVHSGAALSEGPIWDRYQQRLIFVDITRGQIVLADNFGALRTIDHPAGAKIGTAGLISGSEGKRLLVASSSGFFNLDIESTKHKWVPTMTAIPLNVRGRGRPNDGKPGPDGNFYLGTNSNDFKSPIGSFFRVTRAGGVLTILSGVRISNGLCWDLRRQKMYYIDSVIGAVFSFPFAGTITDPPPLPEVAVDLTDQISFPESALDGVEIDNTGNLWIACWGKGVVLCVNPETGERLGVVTLPIPRPTSCCFGGEKFSDLFITSERLDGDPADSGAVYRVSLEGIAQGTAPYELWT